MERKMKPIKTALLTVTIFAVSLTLFPSCGIKGPPQPPLRKNIPQITALQGKLVGSKVHLKWVPSFRYTDGTDMQLSKVGIFRMAEDLSERLARQEEDLAELRERMAKQPTLPGGVGLEVPPVGPVNLRALRISRIPITDFRRHAVLVAELRIEQLLDRVGGGAVHWSEDLAIPVEELPGNRCVYAVVEEDVRGRDSAYSNFVTVLPVDAPPAPTGLAAAVSEKKITLTWPYPQLPEAQTTQVCLLGFNIYKIEEGEQRPPNPVNSTPLPTAAPIGWETYRVISNLQVPGAADRYAYLFWTSPEGAEAGVGQTIISEEQIADYRGRTVNVELTLRAPGGKCAGRLVLDATGAKITDLTATTTTTAGEQQIFGQGANPLIAAKEIALTEAPQTFTLSLTLPIDSKALLLRIEPRTGARISAPFVLEKVSAYAGGSQENLVKNGNFDGFAPTQYEEEIQRFGGKFQYWVSAVYALAAFTLESEPTEPVSVEVKDTFPPGAPANLQAIGSEENVLLTWNAPADEDIRGYLVFRREGAEETWDRVPEQPVQATLFRDTTAVPGVQYTYRVQTVDTSGNRSPFSSEVTAVRPVK
jgi:hypothetical protein